MNGQTVRRDRDEEVVASITQRRPHLKPFVIEGNSPCGEVLEQFVRKIANMVSELDRNNDICVHG